VTVVDGMQELIARAAHLLSCAQHAVALTGAGISVESGIPPFRGKGGIWEKIDPMQYAHIDAFLKHPEDVWRVLIRNMKDVLDQAQPNPAHRGLARLEQLGILKTIITQNVDGLHQLAGNSDVIEFHGSFAWQRCMCCDQMIATAKLDMARMPPRCPCGGIYRPDVVFFGELIPVQALMRAEQLSATCDVMLVIGTSATVQPAAFMPVTAKEKGAKVIEINPEATPLTRSISDFTLMGKAGEVIDEIVVQVEKLLAEDGRLLAVPISSTSPS
jgi:NAD-dependent deacetylase